MAEAIKWNSYIKSNPTDKQCAALLLNHVPEIFYGGAAGGGKTEWHLQEALQYVDVPGYAALILMRSYSDLSLPGALIPKSKDWLMDTDAEWNQQEKRWTFPSNATLTFGYLEHEDDKYRYMTSQFQHIGFDELTQFSQTQYTYMFSRLRRLMDFPVPIRMRSSGNPDGPGFEWVKSYFVDRPNNMERIYIPATLLDNPYLDHEEYIKSLMHLDPLTRRRILEGDWTVRPEGKKFKREWFDIVEDYPKENIDIVRYWDMAGTEPKPGTDPDYMAGALVGLTSDGIYYVIDMRRNRLTPREGEMLITRTANVDVRLHGQGVEIWMEQEPGDSGKRVIDHFTRTVLQGFTFRGNRATGSKEVRANPVSSQAEAGNVKLVRGSWNNDFLDEVTAFPTKGVHDDQVDALSGAFSVLAKPEFKYTYHYANKGKRKSIFEMEREARRNGG